LKVYRIENESQGGPYHQGRIQDLPVCDTVHPIPENDSQLMEATSDLRWSFSENIFGFVSEEQFKFWFYNDEYIDLLIEDGFRMTIYEVPDEYVYIGSTQVIFNSNHAKQFGWKPLENYLAKQVA